MGSGSIKQQLSSLPVVFALCVICEEIKWTTTSGVSPQFPSNWHSSTNDNPFHFYEQRFVRLHADNWKCILPIKSDFPAHWVAVVYMWHHQWYEKNDDELPYHHHCLNILQHHTYVKKTTSQNTIISKSFWSRWNLDPLNLAMAQFCSATMQKTKQANCVFCIDKGNDGCDAMVPPEQPRAYCSLPSLIEEKLNLSS